MTKLQMFGTRMRTETKTDGKTRQVLETRLAEKPQKCKDCGEEPRAPASSRGEKCKEKYRAILYGEKKLEHRRQQYKKSGII